MPNLLDNASKLFLWPGKAFLAWTKVSNTVQMSLISETWCLIFFNSLLINPISNSALCITNSAPFTKSINLSAISLNLGASLSCSGEILVISFASLLISFPSGFI